MNVVQKVKWLRSKMHRTVLKYVSDVWAQERHGEKLCVTMPKILTSAYARIGPGLKPITDANGGNDVTLLRALLEVSSIPYKQYSEHYKHFFEKSPQERASYFAHRVTLLTLHTTPHVRPKPKMLLTVVRNLLIDEGIPVSFGFLFLTDHTMSFTVCHKPTTHFITCNYGKCYVVNHAAGNSIRDTTVQMCTLVVYRPRRPDP